MATIPKDVQEFMSTHGVDHDEVWQVHGASWVVKHKALERIAMQIGITFDLPEMIEGKSGDKIVAMCVRGFIPGTPIQTAWSIGEASPANNKNSYPYAMAEKRAKDRVILKLLNAHGALYSEDEADDFKAPNGPRKNPHVTEPGDIVDLPDYDERGQPIDSIPHGDASITPLPKAKSREDYAACEREIRACMTVEELRQWGALNANRVQRMPGDWANILRGEFASKQDELRSNATLARQREVA